MQGRTILLRIGLRRFSGALHANTLTMPLVQVDLGMLEPGTYDAVASVSEHWFAELGHADEAAGSEPTQEARVSFLVALFDAV